MATQTLVRLAAGAAEVIERGQRVIYKNRILLLPEALASNRTGTGLYDLIDLGLARAKRTWRANAGDRLPVERLSQDVAGFVLNAPDDWPTRMQALRAAYVTAFHNGENRTPYAAIAQGHVGDPLIEKAAHASTEALQREALAVAARVPGFQSRPDVGLPQRIAGLDLGDSPNAALHEGDYQLVLELARRVARSDPAAAATLRAVPSPAERQRQRVNSTLWATT